MSQVVVQGIVGAMADAFLAAGLADPGVYTAPGIGSTPIPCTVFIDRAVAPFGSFGKVINSDNHLGLLLSQVPMPVRDALVVADGKTWKLVQMEKQDDAVSTWAVTNV